MYYVYILKSLKDNSFYIGFSTDIERRIQEHNAGKSRYTSQKTPWELAYFELFSEKRDALKRELFLKKQKNRDFYERLITLKKGA